MRPPKSYFRWIISLLKTKNWVIIADDISDAFVGPDGLDGYEHLLLHHLEEIRLTKYRLKQQLKDMDD